jgi:hypothetical protein
MEWNGIGKRGYPPPSPLYRITNRHREASDRFRFRGHAGKDSCERLVQEPSSSVTYLPGPVERACACATSEASRNNLVFTGACPGAHILLIQQPRATSGSGHLALSVRTKWSLPNVKRDEEKLGISGRRSLFTQQTNRGEWVKWSISATGPGVTFGVVYVPNHLLLFYRPCRARRVDVGKRGRALASCLRDEARQKTMRQRSERRTGAFCFVLESGMA